MLKVIPRKAGRVLLIAIGVIFVFILATLVYFLIKSPGKVLLFFDENQNVLENSISEKIFVDINNVSQGMFIKGENINNPVLLFLHGGPGMPEYFLADRYKTELEKYFTVCYWEQRGAGLSYNPDISSEDITVSRLVSDTAEVANYLRRRFGQDKVYLMGHSWGTFIGIKAAAANPELYNAYIGMSQVSNTVKSEIIAYDYMLGKYGKDGNAKKVREFKKYDIHNDKELINDYMSSSLRDNSMHELGIGTMRNMHSVVSGIFFPVMNCGAYTLGEKINIWVAKSFLNKSTNLRQEMLNTDLSETITELEIPVYFIAGSYDYTVNYNLQEEYFNKINAPKKGFYTFENSAHSPLFEEPERFIEIAVNDIKNVEVRLADK